MLRAYVKANNNRGHFDLALNFNKTILKLSSKSLGAWQRQHTLFMHTWKAWPVNLPAVRTRDTVTRRDDSTQTSQTTVTVKYSHVFLQNPVYEVGHKYSEKAIQKFSL